MTEKNNVVDQVVSMSQILLKPDADSVTPQQIEDTVIRVATFVAPAGLSSADKAAATSELIRRFSHWIGKIATLKNDAGHEPWLVSTRREGWKYWPRYKDYLERKLSTDVVEALEESTNEILGMLEDPRRSGAWDRRGLVVGHVQSGKTSSYSGVLCKAADAGYKIIIVLAGMHNSLRSQTQIRLEESFLGYETSTNRDPGKPIGVGVIDSDNKILPHCATTRADNGDFNMQVANHFAAITPEELPWLFVVKKNKSVLSKLLKWIRTKVADASDPIHGHRVVTNLPLLVIDDEADNASVDTGEQFFNEDGTPDQEHQPKAINSLIRQILHAFSKSAYVGYTATPFANIFIHRKGETAVEGPDLFPQSFIINLAAPSNYVGPARVVGRRAKDGREDGLPLVRPIADYFDADTTLGWMPPKHKKDHTPAYNGQDIPPPSLVEAIYSFALACAVRVCRGQQGEHASMLVHVTRFVLVQEKVRSQVEEVVRRARQRLFNRVDHNALIEQIHRLWLDDFLETNRQLNSMLMDANEEHALPHWEDILKVLPNVFQDIQVRSINGTAKDALDYAENETVGLKVIAIGGDKLARGLTLEGLCTSYFVRTTKMYDTLMQMGRWFGYRPNYLDICRLYTSADLVEWFGHIADASEELREEFDSMVERGRTPEDYGLKVQSHPTLTVTSPLKMRNSHRLSLSYSGTLQQSITLWRDKQKLQTNLNAADRMLSNLGKATVFGPSQSRADGNDEWRRSSLWLDVGSGIVIDFLREFVTHPKAHQANSSVIADFISNMNSAGELTLWSVALVCEGHTGEPFTFSNGLTISSFPSRSDTQVPGRYSIGVLTDPSDEGIDLPLEPWKLALDWTKAARLADPKKGGAVEPKRPSGKRLREVRQHLGGDVNRGVLLLYPLSPYSKSGSIIDDWELPIIAWAAAFPTSDSTVKVEYEVDLLYWEQEYGPSE